MNKKLEKLKKKYNEKLQSLKATKNKRKREDLQVDLAGINSEIRKLKRKTEPEKRNDESSSIKKVRCDGCGEEFEFDNEFIPDIFQDLDKELCISDKALFDLPYDGFTFQGVMKNNQVFCQSCCERKFEKLPINQR